MWGECPWNFLDETDPIRQRFIQGLEQNAPQPDIWMQVTVPNEFQPVGRYNIGITAGIETTVFPSEFIEGLNRMDLNLISSTHSKEVALQSSFDKKDKQTNKTIGVLKAEKPVEVLFEGLDLEKYNKNPQNSGLLNDISEDFCFLFTGHWLQGNFGEDRKDVATLIKTFLKTFNTPSKKKPALILKTNSVNYSLLDRENTLKQIHRIKNLPELQGGNLPNIYLLHGEMTDDEINQLNNDNKVKAFVSFTKGEGYGRPLAESSITGKPTIVSNWSGHLDFLHPDYNVLIGGDLKNVHESAANQFLLKESRWFNINVDVAGRAMKDMFKDYKRYLNGSRKQTQYMKDNWTFDKMAEKLNDLLPNIEPKPQLNNLTLPKLKKMKKNTNELPQLQKINIEGGESDMNWRGTDIKLPNLKKIQI